MGVAVGVGDGVAVGVGDGVGVGVLVGVGVFVGDGVAVGSGSSPHAPSKRTAMMSAQTRVVSLMERRFDMMGAIEAQAGSGGKVNAHFARYHSKSVLGEPVEPRIGLRQAQAERGRRPYPDAGKALSWVTAIMYIDPKRWHSSPQHHTSTSGHLSWSSLRICRLRPGTPRRRSSRRTARSLSPWGRTLP